MVEFLALMVGAKKGSILLFLFLTLLIALLYKISKTSLPETVPRSLYTSLGGCIFWGAYMCGYIGDIALHTAGRGVGGASSAVFWGWGVLAFHAGYLAFFFTALKRFIGLQPGALRRFRFVVGTFPIAMMLLWLVCNSSYNFFFEGGYRITVMEGELQRALSIHCVFAVPYLLYLLFSSSIRSAWVVIGGKQEG